MDFFFRIDDIYLFVERTITYKILHIMKKYYYKQKFIIMDIMKFNTQALKEKKKKFKNLRIVQIDGRD